MAVDANLVLQASTTAVVTTTSTGVGLPTGTPSRGLVARIVYSAATEASGGKTVTFSIQHGDTLGGTYYALTSAADQVITLSTTAQAGEISIPFRTSRAFVRLVMTLSASTNSPTITYFADIALGLPG
jgi:hypothetical protein